MSRNEMQQLVAECNNLSQELRSVLPPSAIKSVAEELEQLRARHFARVTCTAAAQGTASTAAALRHRGTDSEELFVGKLTRDVLRGLVRQFCGRSSESEGTDGASTCSSSARAGPGSATSATLGLGKVVPAESTSAGSGPDMSYAFAYMGLTTPQGMTAARLPAITGSPSTLATSQDTSSRHAGIAAGAGAGAGVGSPSAGYKGSPSAQIARKPPSMLSPTAFPSSSSSSQHVVEVDPAFLGSLSASAHERLHPGKREYLPDASKAILRAWFVAHLAHPYPTEAEKAVLARKADTTIEKVSNYFINARARDWGRLTAASTKASRGAAARDPSSHATHAGRKRKREEEEEEEEEEVEEEEEEAEEEQDDQWNSGQSMESTSHSNPRGLRSSIVSPPAGLSTGIGIGIGIGMGMGMGMSVGGLGSLEAHLPGYSTAAQAHTGHARKRAAR